MGSQRKPTYKSFLSIGDRYAQPITQVDTFLEKGFLLGSRALSDEQVEELREELARVIDDYERDDVTQPVHIVNLGGREESPVWQVVNIWEASSAYHRLVHNPVIVEEIGQLTAATELRVWHDQIQYKPPQVGGCQHVASGFTLLADSYAENESGNRLGCVGRC